MLVKLIDTKLIPQTKTILALGNSSTVLSLFLWGSMFPLLSFGQTLLPSMLLKISQYNLSTNVMPNYTAQR